MSAQQANTMLTRLRGQVVNYLSSLLGSLAILFFFYFLTESKALEAISNFLYHPLTLIPYSQTQSKGTLWKTAKASVTGDDATIQSFGTKTENISQATPTQVLLACVDFDSSYRIFSATVKL